jgi:hypothetical protein
MPEQPPDRTPIRRYRCSTPCFARRSSKCLRAESETVMTRSVTSDTPSDFSVDGRKGRAQK